LPFPPHRQHQSPLSGATQNSSGDMLVLSTGSVISAMTLTAALRKEQRKILEIRPFESLHLWKRWGKPLVEKEL
jgi:hypothetical protein